MHIKDIIGLIGLRGSDPALAAWFAQHGLASPPATITANQGQKSARDKAHGMEYHFAFDIIHDRFYPPREAKRGSWASHLKSVTLYSHRPRNAPAVPAGFWSGYVGPEASLQDCLDGFDGQMQNFGDTAYFEKVLADDVQMKLWFDQRRQHVQELQINLVEDRQFIGHHDFDPDNEHNTFKQASTLLVRWLFERGHLKLTDALRAAGPGEDHEAILHFTKQRLHNHIWKSQVQDDPSLHAVLAHSQTTRPLILKDGTRLPLYAPWMLLKAADCWDAHQALYSDDALPDWSERLTAFERSVTLDAAQQQAFLSALDEAYRCVKSAQGAA